jgi:phycocyanobilin:ferredoxin oxidoreductase
MDDAFGFAALTVASETLLVDALQLQLLPLPPDLVRAAGTWKGSAVTIETHAYAGEIVRYARFTRLVGGTLAIGNVLCLSDATYPLPIFGADLVGLGGEMGMVAADLSPTLPPGPARDEQLRDLAARRAATPPLPNGGALPAWCADWFSPHALYTRVTRAQAAEAARVYGAFPAAFVALARGATPHPDQAATVAAAQAGYAAAHRTDDKGLGLLAKMFGAAWAERYVAEVLFPPLGVPV